MSENFIPVEEETTGSDTAVPPSSRPAVSPAETSRRLVMASIGVAVIAGGRMKSLVSRFIESEEAEATIARSHRRPTPTNSLLMRLNIPTKSDIDALNSQVAALLDKIEALQEQEQQLSPTSPNPAENHENESARD